MRNISQNFALIFILSVALAQKGEAQNVGVGTPTPTDPLTVKSASNGLGISQETADKSVRVGFFTSVAAGAFLQTHTNHDLQFSTNNDLAQMVLQKNTGNVGIGTLNPLRGGLVVDRKVGAVNALFGSNTTGVAIESNFPGIGFNSYFSGGRKLINDGFGALISLDPNTGNLSFFNTDISGSTGQSPPHFTRILINKDGNIGIQGNTNPGAPLSFSNTIGNKIALWGDPASGHYGLGVQGSLLQLYSASSQDDIAFGYGRSTVFNEVMRIKGNGRVGIGTNSPTALLHINGSFRLANGTEGQGRKLVSDATGAATWRSDAYGAVSAYSEDNLLAEQFDFVDNTFYPAPFIKERLDVSNLFNPASAQYNVPETGYYRIYYTAPLRSMTDLPGSSCVISLNYQAEIRKNSVTFLKMPGTYKFDCQLIVTSDAPIISEIVFLTAGEVLTFGIKSRDGYSNSFEVSPATLMWHKSVSINISKM